MADEINNQKKWKTRDDFQQVTQPKRHHEALEVIGTIIIWAAPVIEILAVILWNWGKIMKQSGDASFNVPFWLMFVSFCVICFYITWGRKKLLAVKTANQAKNQKNPPFIILLDWILMLFALGFLTCLEYFLARLGRPVMWYLIALMGLETLGWALLFWDSFHQEKYF